MRKNTFYKPSEISTVVQTICFYARAGVAGFRYEQKAYLIHKGNKLLLILGTSFVYYAFCHDQNVFFSPKRRYIWLLPHFLFI